MAFWLAVEAAGVVVEGWKQAGEVSPLKWEELFGSYWKMEQVEQEEHSEEELSDWLLV